MTIQLWNFSSETIYVQDVSFIVKGFTMKLFFQIFLNSVIYETFPFETFYAYSKPYKWSTKYVNILMM